MAGAESHPGRRRGPLSAVDLPRSIGPNLPLVTPSRRAALGNIAAQQRSASTVTTTWGIFAVQGGSNGRASCGRSALRYSPSLQAPLRLRDTGDLLMPCHEYCGLGHSEMWATVQVVPENEFKPDRDGRVSCAQR
jgi:hypothetical protein